MRNNLVIGILRETKHGERRAPLTPDDVRWLIARGIKVEVQSSRTRIFKDIQYKKAGATVVNKFKEAALLLGVKEPKISTFYKDKIYMIFSHTIKGQPQNMPLLKACLKKNITLIDYEKIVDNSGKRLVYFGEFAGICGIVDSLHYMSKKLKNKGISNPFTLIKPSHKYKSLDDLKKDFKKVDNTIKNKGFNDYLTPFIIGITGHGNVSKGVQEILDLLDPIEIHPKDIMKFVNEHKKEHNRIYKIVFLREEKIRTKTGEGFYFEEYCKYPDRFESNLDKYLDNLNMLIHTSYWDPRYPRLITKEMINQLSNKKPFRLEFIGDISCDVCGSIELTCRATTTENPVFTYNPKTKKYKNGYASQGVTILAIDNLPSELPKDASERFSYIIRDYVYQIAAHGVIDITNHIAIPLELRRAVITESGQLTQSFSYLSKHIKNIHAK